MLTNKSTKSTVAALLIAYSSIFNEYLFVLLFLDPLIEERKKARGFANCLKALTLTR